VLVHRGRFGKLGSVLLAIDIGNTNLVFGLFENESLKLTFRAETVRSRTADEYAALLRQLIFVREIPASEVDAAIIASVVPQLTDVVAQAVKLAFGQRPIVVGPGTKTGISVRYDNPHDVGADRIVNAVAAHQRYEGGVIVVDLGTATTFDCVSPKGEYLGGVIAPGVQVSLDALMARAAKLQPIELAVPPRVVGRNTANALQSGVIFGYASLIDGLVTRIKAELGYPCQVIATGGLATLLAPHCASIEHVEPDLTLDGLRILYERNR
jgi:type III pantothenate kinase